MGIDVRQAVREGWRPRRRGSRRLLRNAGLRHSGVGDSFCYFSVCILVACCTCFLDGLPMYVFSCELARRELSPIQAIAVVAVVGEVCVWQLKCTGRTIPCLGGILDRGSRFGA